MSRTPTESAVLDESQAVSQARVRTRVGDWVWVLVIYAATRAYAFGVVLLTAPLRVVDMDALFGYHTTVAARLPADYATVMTSWDGQWYWQVVLHGYPETAVAPDGTPQQTALAFYPLYPTVVRGLTTVTGLGFEVVAPTLSLLLGAAAMLVVHRLLSAVVDRGRALAAVALVCCFVSAPILQAAYTESLALLLVASALLCLARRRYSWTLLLILLLGLTRNIALVMAPVVALHWWTTWRRAGVGDAVPHGRLAVLTVIPLVATALWPAVVGVITGDARGYLTTLKAWPGFTSSPLRPPWVNAGLTAGPAGWFLFALVVVLFVALVSGRTQRAWGPELWGWTVAYSVYVALTTSVSGSIIRYLLLAFPFALVLLPPAETEKARLTGWWVAGTFCALGLVAQAVWVSKFLVYAGPNGGWGFP